MLQAPKAMKEKHAKLRVRDGDARPFDALGWSMMEQVNTLGLVAGDQLDMVYRIEESTNQDFPGTNLVIRDVRKAQPTAAKAAAVETA